MKFAALNFFVKHKQNLFLENGGGGTYFHSLQEINKERITYLILEKKIKFFFSKVRSDLKKFEIFQYFKDYKF